MDDLKYLNMEALQEIYAMKYYKVHKAFPKSKDSMYNKQSLIWNIKLLTRKEQS